MSTLQTVEFCLKYLRLCSQLHSGELINLAEVLSTGRL